MEYKWNIQNNTLYVTKRFERQAGIYGTDEYTIYQNIKKDNADMNVDYMKEYKTERNTENIHRLKTKDMIEEIKESKNSEAIIELGRIMKHHAETKQYVGKLKKLYFDTYPEKLSLATLKKKAKAKKEEAEKREFINKTNNNADSSTSDANNESNE